MNCRSSGAWERIHIDLRNIQYRNARGATSLIAGPNAGQLQISSFGGEASILSVKLSWLKSSQVTKSKSSEKKPELNLILISKLHCLSLHVALCFRTPKRSTSYLTPWQTQWRSDTPVHQFVKKSGSLKAALLLFFSLPASAEVQWRCFLQETADSPGDSPSAVDSKSHCDSVTCGFYRSRSNPLADPEPSRSPMGLNHLAETFKFRILYIRIVDPK